MNTRIRCKVFGCSWDHNGVCTRCDTYIYDPDFIQLPHASLSWYYSLRHWWHMNSFYRYHRCEVCKEQLFFTDNECCSKKCYEEWVPF